MRLSRTRASFERSAGEDLWRKTLSHIPTVLGRLAYLSQLRNANTGRYEHHGLAAVAGERDAEKALSESHLRAFREWIAFSLEEQKADLDLYFSSLSEPRREVIENWILSLCYVNLVPSTIHGVERDLFLSDMQALLETLKNFIGAAGPDREA
ncbi:MAG: hypothetical protein ABI823_04605 [Bryobacteraceae bacterium]